MTARSPLRLFPLLILGALIGCHGSNSSSPAPIGFAPDPVVGPDDPLPGVAVAITDVRGGSGPGGRFRVGDTITVDFTVRRADGVALELANMTRGAIMVSGPTFDYQRVIGSQGDVIANATKTALGAYSYKFPVPIPATYMAPLNDSPALTDGERTGQALLSGTYTVGIELRKDYTVDGVVHRDPGNTTADFLFGDATTLDSREVVAMGNCNQCHTELRAHGDNRNNVTNCLLCHTAGSEDRVTDPATTPGVTIDFKVMIHKIHAGAQLPSVLGVATNTDGTRNYNATPQPYEIIGFGDQVHDFSHVAFPQWPSMFTPMPRDLGYAALQDTTLPANDPVRLEGARRQGLENTMRSGPVGCAACHGDPDGSGPIAAPADGDLIYAQPTRAACASCHDDWDPELPYRANSSTMPIQRDDAACKDCHRPSGTPLDVMDAHRHPLVDPTFARGLNFTIDSVTDVGNGDGRFTEFEKVAVRFHVADDSGAPVPASSLSRLEMALTGPTTNPNMVHLVRVATARFTGDGPYTVNLPTTRYLESIGTSTAGLQTFTTALAPHWNVNGALTELRRRTGDGAASTLVANAPVDQNWVDVAAGDGVLFAGQPYVVIDDADGARREFLRVQQVDGDRLWFGSQYRAGWKPALAIAHALGAQVKVVTTAAIPNGSWSLPVNDAITQVREDVEFGDGEVLCTYTTDFQVPGAYPGSLNESPDLDESWGDWTGLPLLDGTYTLGVYGARSLTFSATAPPPAAPEDTGYTEGGKAATARLLFGAAPSLQVVRRIDGVETCNACHADIQFHGGSRRGVETCLLCHGNAGSEDAANYTYPAADATPFTTVDFRTMLHKIHHGKELAAGTNYVVVGNGGTGHTYEHVGFPSFPGGTLRCVTCHGEDNTAWQAPAERNHPMQVRPTRSWLAACGSCHDSTAQRAHIDANTAPSGAEACAICHGAGEDNDVIKVHTVR
ncbi:MAG: hypothetical protein AB7O97_07200 [Planctomycetota bacterium]